MTILYAPSGMPVRMREDVTCPPEYMKMLAVFAETSAQVDLGLHCSRCKENLRGENAREDTKWKMECGCRTFIGENPIPVTARRAQ